MVHHQEQPDEGALFDVEVVGNGSTDPGNFAVKNNFVMPGEEASIEHPEERPPAPEEIAVAAAVRSAVVTQHHRDAQVGKHSPLARTGNYADDVQPGDFLPGGFGVVTGKNLDAARTHARALDAARTHKRTA